NEAGLYVNYTCNTLSGTGVCLPPMTSGLGELVTPSTGGGAQVYSGCAGIFNATWVAASTLAGGGSTPYSDTFKSACPNASSFNYDDVSSNYSCPFTSDSTAVSFTITLNGTLAAVGPHHSSGMARPKVPHRHSAP